jgi:L-lactate dehydrogenase complex protein LldF
MSTRFGLGVWAFFAKRPKLYRLAARFAAWALRRLASGSGRIGSLPLAKGWTAWRDLPASSGRTFQQQWAAHREQRP